MMLETSTEYLMNSEILGKYFESLISGFYKILPMSENKESTLLSYMKGLQVELIGLQGFICAIKREAHYLRLLSILQYLIQTPDCDISVIKREVFTAISICKKLGEQYCDKEAEV